MNDDILLLFYNYNFNFFIKFENVIREKRVGYSKLIIDFILILKL